MKIKHSNKNGFTLIELLVVLAMLSIIVVGFGFGLIGAGCMGNQWFTTEGALRQIKFSNSNVVDVVTYERNIFRKSSVTVRLSDGSTAEYLVDSDVLFNHKVTLKQ